MLHEGLEPIHLRHHWIIWSAELHEGLKPNTP